MEHFRCQCSTPHLHCSTLPSGCIVCSPGVSLTREEQELLETPPRRLTCEDKKRRRVLKKRLGRAEMSPERRASGNEASRQRQVQRRAEPETRATENDRKRKRRAERSPETRASENEASRQKEAKRVAELTPQARSAELKRKAEKEALRRAGMSRLEHERVLQQQRDAYRRRMNALSESDRREMNERIKRRRTSRKDNSGSGIIPVGRLSSGLHAHGRSATSPRALGRTGFILGRSLFSKPLAG